MNRQTWKALQEHGVSEGTRLRLEFFYVSPSQESADDLAGFLRRETQYDVRARADMVTGWTDPISASLEALDSWVEWMVKAGDAHGRCEFDGWGAKVS